MTGRSTTFDNYSDPDGRGLNDHWVKTGAALLTGTILHLLYAEPTKTLRGVAGFLSDPKCTLMETIERMIKAECQHRSEGTSHSRAKIHQFEGRWPW
jgi:type IV secretory pathway TraG/TraD family ATPase VirD4